MDEQKIEEILHERKVKRIGARVFCVRCGAGQRTPLRRWHNSYICQECWKVLQAVGEEAFIAEMKGLDENGLPYYSNHAERLVKGE